MEEISIIYYNVISQRRIRRNGVTIKTKPVFTDEFKQGVIDYVLSHSDESKVSIAQKFGVADSTVHKWMKEAKDNDYKIESRGSGIEKRTQKYTRCIRYSKKGYRHTGKINKQDIYEAVKISKKDDQTVSVSSVLKK